MRCAACMGFFTTFALAVDHGGTHEPIVPVDQEPNHRLVLRGTSARVFDVAFPPGQASLFHRHDKDSVMVCLQGADVPSEEPGKPVAARPPIPSGDIYYRAYARNPFVHRIRNVGQSDFRMLDIEILKEPAAPGAPYELATLPAAADAVIDNERVRVSRISVGAYAATDLMHFNGSHLLVSMTDGEFDLERPDAPSARLATRRGNLHLEENPQQWIIRNPAGSALEFVAIEVK